MEARGIDNFVKFTYFHKEQNKSFKNNPFLPDNLFYNPEGNFYVCPMGQELEFIGQYQRISDRGDQSEFSLYQAKRCEGCPLRGSCHKAQGNRRIEVNHNLKRHKDIARTNLTSEKGLMHRSKRPIEPEAVFGQIKSNRKFNRFRLKGLEGVAVEFGLISIALNISKMAKKPSIEAKSSFKAAKLSLKNLIFDSILYYRDWWPVMLNYNRFSAI